MFLLEASIMSNFDHPDDGGVALTPPTPSPPPSSLNWDDAREERRNRRRISNRESARRSRMRKQQHLDGLRARATHLESENRALADQLGAIVQNCLLIRRNNAQLHLECTVLRRRLADANGILMLRQLQRLAALQMALAGTELNAPHPICYAQNHRADRVADRERASDHSLIGAS